MSTALGNANVDTESIIRTHVPLSQVLAPSSRPVWATTNNTGTEAAAAAITALLQVAYTQATAGHACEAIPAVLPLAHAQRTMPCVLAVTNHHAESTQVAVQIGFGVDSDECAVAHAMYILGPHHTAGDDATVIGRQLQLRASGSSDQVQGLEISAQMAGKITGAGMVEAWELYQRLKFSVADGRVQVDMRVEFAPQDVFRTR